jgi:PAS domain S-box-containing protein
MNTPLRVLMVEDSADDALLVVRELEKGGYTVKSQRVDTHLEMSAALKKQPWDIILSDYRMPHFSGPDALKLLRQTGLDVPFITVSGKIGEETAVELMLAGADDYVTKTNLKRLFPAVQRELREAEVHRERQRAERQLVSQAKFPSENPHPVLRVNRECVILFHNKASFPLLQYWQTEIGKPLPKDWCQLIEDVYKNGFRKTAEVKFEDKVYLLNVVPVIDNEYVNIYATDITDLKNAETWVQHLNQILLTIRQVNQLIVTIDDENELLQQTCDALVQGRHYISARVGLIQKGGDEIRWAAKKAADQVLVPDTKVTWDDSEHGQGPSGIAIKTGQPVVIGDITTDERFRPWRDDAVKSGIASLCALPLVIRKQAIGILIVYSGIVQAFNDEEIGLLTELAGDISLGLEKIRQRQETKQVNAKYAALVENSNDGIIILQDAKVKFSSTHMDRLTGFSPAEYLEKPFIGFVSPSSQAKAVEYYKKRQAGEEVPGRYELELLTKDNKSIPVEMNASIIEYEGRPANMAIVRDIRERKQAEAALRESQSHLEEAHRLAHIGIWNWDAATDTVTWSKELYEIAGLDPGLPAPTYAEHPKVYTPVSFTRLSEAVEEALQKGKIYQLELEMVRPDGTHRWVNAFGGPKYGEDGKVFGLHGTVQDITESKQAEQELIKREAFLNNIIEQTPNALWLSDNKGTMLRMNQALRDFLQITDEEVVGKYNVLKDTQVKEQGFMPLVKSVFAAGKTVNFTLDYYTGKVQQLQLGKTAHRVIDIVMSPIKNEQGKVVNVICQEKDITEQELAKAALAESETKYRSIFEEALDGIVLIDAATDYLVSCNPAYEQLTGRTLEQLRKMKAWEIRPPAQIEATKKFLRETKENGQGSSAELAFQRPDGTVVPVESRASIITLGANKYIQGISRDITERKQGEEELKFRAQLLNAANDLILALDSKGKVIYFNDTAHRSLGYSREEMAKKTLHDIATSEYFRIMSSQVNKLLEEKGEAVFEATIMRKDKSIMPVEVHSRMVTLDNQEFILNVIRDITRRKQQDEVTRASEENFRRSIEESPMGIRIIDAEGKALFTNRAFVEMWGYDTAEEFEATPPQERYAPADYLLYQKRVARRARGEYVPTDYEARIKRKNGELRYLAVSRKDILWNGHPRFQVIYQDITERKLAEEALKESEEKYHNLVERANDGICILQDTNVEYCNQRLAQMWGGSVAEITGKPFIDFIHPDSLDTVVNNYRQRMAGKAISPIYQVMLKRRDGGTIYSELNAGVIVYKGKPADLVIIRDITERKQAEEKLRENEQRLKEAQALGKIGNWEFDLTTQQITWSDEMYEIFELDKTQKPPSPDEQASFYSPEENSKWREATTLAIESGQEFHTDLTANLPNGKTVFLHTSIRPVKNNEGRVVKLFAIVQDITERKNGEVALEQSYEKLQQTLDGIITAMAATIEIRDPYTAGHQNQTAQLARAIAQEMGLPQDQINGIHTAGLIHDIGKIGIPSDILSKPGKLSALEFSLIKAHSQIGSDILKNIDFPYPVAQWILQHHERLNGSGYPAGLSGDKISPEAKVLAVADVVEAMASHRPYRRALGIPVALDEIAQNKNILYDAAAVDACIRLFKEKGFKFK